MQLNIRQKEILLDCLQDDTLTVKRLTIKYNVSRRTIYNDIAYLKDWAIYNEISFDQNNKYLFKIINEEHKSKIKELIEEIIPFVTPLNQHERANLILANLFLNPKVQSISQMCDCVGISRTTFYRDIEYVKLWLDKFGVILQVSKTKGIELQCKESKLREAIAFFIKKNFDNYDLLSLLQSNVRKMYLRNEKSIIFDLLKEYLKDFNIQKVIDIVCKIEIYQGYEFLDNYNISYIWLITISLVRNKLGFHICDESNKFKKYLYSKEYKLIKYSIHDEFDMELREDEILFLVFHLTTIKCKHVDLNLSDYNLEYKIMRLIENISYRLNISLVMDVQLIEGLRFHIYTTLERMKNDLVDLNPIKDRIIEKYGEIFEVCKEEINKSEIFSKNIDDDEVSFIVLYIAAAVERVTRSHKNVYAVCTTGRGSAHLLLTNLKNKFPNINIIDTISIQTASTLTKVQADAIISTAYFHNKEIQVIVVSPLLLKEDILKIRKDLMIESAETDSKILTVSSNKDLSFPDYMYMLGDCATTAEELGNTLHITFSNSEYIGVMMHLMMQIYQVMDGGNVIIEELNDHDLVIYQSLLTLYRKYNKYPSNYDIKSINAYIKNERK